MAELSSSSELVVGLVVRLIWDSEEEDEMRKGRGCVLHYQASPLRVVTPFTAQTDGTLGGDASTTYFLGPDWQVTGCIHLLASFSC